jgi:hypothetical protein
LSHGGHEDEGRADYWRASQNQSEAGFIASENINRPERIGYTGRWRWA